ncbi:DUF7010 family protein [Croceiramulus getboli]|nr:hypothetical protein P8624_13960 [Flavobacteriaceae bacterium YJPT1-3]
METHTLPQLKKDLQVQAKKGLDFILAAGLLWLAIAWLWTLDYSAYNSSIFTFMISGLMLPLAFGFSKLLNTKWTLKNNLLQPLGLWLNVAQVIYFPFLIYVLVREPDYFLMAYAIITGAHLFPYAWLYEEWGYAVASVLISVGGLLLALYLETDNFWLIPVFTSIMLFLLAGRIYRSWKTTAQRSDRILVGS